MITPHFPFETALRISGTAPVRCLAALLALLFLSGCAAVFIAPYDETTDRLLTDLSVKTETAIIRADSGQLSAQEAEKFFGGSLGAIRTMKARSALFAKNENEVAALGQLE
jgi:hypothetical protein